MAKKEKTRKEKKYADKDGKWRVVVVLDDATGKETNVVFLKFDNKPKKKEIDDLVANLLGEL